jgi:hypothetical protein
MKDNNMKIEHYENGDSDFTIEVKVKKSAGDDQGTTVSIGSLITLTIVDYYDGSGSLIEIGDSGEYLYSPSDHDRIGFSSREEALDFILVSLKESNLSLGFTSWS